MKSCRVLVLVHPDLVPPDSLKGLSEAEAQPFRTEFDVVAGLKKLGHTVEVLGVQHDITRIREAVARFEPDIVFNLLAEFHHMRQYDAYVVAYLELLGVPYTGCHPRGLFLARDKALSKKILTYHKLPVPKFQVFPRNKKAKRQKRMAFPLFVKPLSEEASTGIAKASLVEDDQKLEERVAFVHERFKTHALVEQFVPGREVYASVLGNDRLVVYPPWEIVFNKKPDDAPLIATEKAKWDLSYQKKWGIKIQAADLDAALTQKLARLSRRIYRRLDLSGCARFDFRLTDAGEFFFLEANPNPDIGEEEEFASAAKAGGVDYGAFLNRLLQLGLQRV